MGLFSKMFGSEKPIDVMRADIFMEYRPLTSTGVAAVEWVPLEFYDPNLRPYLIALLYARILVAHSETRSKLFGMVNELSKQNVRDEGQSGFIFPEWILQIGMGAPDQRIWPWTLIDSSSALSEAKVYGATLQALPESRRFSINLKMALGQERILAPASVLIAITSYIETTDQEGCYELAVLLWQVNEYYGSADRVRIGSETEALAAATSAIRSGDLRVP